MILLNKNIFKHKKASKAKKLKIKLYFKQLNKYNFYLIIYKT